MPIEYVVKQGDCFHSIAAEHGVFWEDLWNAPENHHLRAARRQPELIQPGDKVVIRDKLIKQDAGETGLDGTLGRCHRALVCPAIMLLPHREAGEQRDPHPCAPHAHGQRRGA